MVHQPMPAHRGFTVAKLLTAYAYLFFEAATHTHTSAFAVNKTVVV